MLGCLKAGVSIFPIDPTYPKARVEYMLYDSKARFVISEEPLTTSLYDSLSHLSDMKLSF